MQERLKGSESQDGVDGHWLAGPRDWMGGVFHRKQVLDTGYLYLYLARLACAWRSLARWEPPGSHGSVLGSWEPGILGSCEPGTKH